MGEIIPSDAVQAIKDSVKTELIIGEGADSFFNRPVHLPPAEPTPNPLRVHTLQGLVDFVTSEGEGYGVSLHIVDHKAVRAIGALAGRHQQRPIYAEAHLLGEPKFPFDRFLPAEDFIIKLQTAFSPSDETRLLLSLIGNLRDESVKTVGDDGISQAVTVKKGVSLVQEAPVPNPIRLAPFRTWAEIDQPSSLYVLRLRRVEGELPQVALFETGDSAWQLEAIESTKAFLLAKLGETKIPIIA
ncbi:MAG TPA: hypothetical protein VJ302_26920 [Blastocatellia bacterium]|nr:hypothetical protein [Blastocatellia bacterium]